MTFWNALALGLVQGVTEFLPVSSSGHLVIARQWMGVVEDGLTFDVVVHAGSLAAVATAMRAEIRQMLRGLFGGRDEEARLGRILLWRLVLATLPVVIAGFTLRGWVAEAFASPYVTPLLLYATGGLLWFADRRAELAARTPMGAGHALWMGLAQAAAVLPGLSRAGMTIAAGMLAGLDRQQAARFSFLMSMPAIAGAAVLEAPQIFKGGGGAPFSPAAYGAGFLVSLIASYLAISVLLSFLRRGRLIGFAYYTWILATVVLLLI